MITIIFESHSTTFDNEAHIASGWNDTALSPLGIDQANDLGKRYHDEKIGAVFCSDLVRSYHTAEIAFYGKNIPIYEDKRLRECNYGEFAGKASDIVASEKVKRINTAFLRGESYKEVMDRMKSFLDDLLKNFDGKTVMIIGHNGTQFALEHLILKKPLEEVIIEPWHWQPGWTYSLR